MTLRRRHSALLPAVLLTLCPVAAAAEPTSPWVRDGAAALRLVDAGEAGSGDRLAGIAIRLENGWKTYWRQPGDSGVPPLFDFSRSTNVAAVAVGFPVPEQARDEAGVTNVYHGDVLLPVTVRPMDPAAPVSLVLVADYGVCEAVCVPVHVETALDLEADGGFQGPAAAAVRRAQAAAPRLTPLGAAFGGLSIASVRASGAGLEVAVATPGGAPVLLFAETGAGDYVATPTRLEPLADGLARYRIVFDAGGPPPSGLRLTLASGGAAIETAVPLDAIARAP